VKVIVAARNEAERIEATLAALRAALPGAELWVADDASHDATAELAGAAGAHVVSAARHAGKGAAMGTAARLALAAPADSRGARTGPGEERSDELFLLCDGDLGESAGELAALVAVVRDRRAELAVAAFRERRGGGFGVARGFARWAVRRRCGLDLVAPLSGQRALSGELLGRLLPFAGGYGMELGMTIDAARRGARVAELELALTHRAGGRTPAGFAHRARQLFDLVRAYGARGGGGA
jgi:glycosyltransferase involved in cell wall biosynthesis